MLQFIFILFAFILFFLLFVLLIPYHYQLNIIYKNTMKYFFSIKFAFISFKIKGNIQSSKITLSFFSYSFNLNKIPFLKDKDISSLSKLIKYNNTDKKETKSFKNKFDYKLFSAVISQDNLNHIFKFIIKLLNYLKSDLLKIKLHFSLSDPYYTGLFFAYYYSLKKLFKKGVLELKVSWQETIFKGDLEITGKVIIIKLIWILITFLFSLRTLRLLKQFYKITKN